MTHLYIGCAASIYPTPPIWYIDVKSQRNRTCLKLHCLLWIRTSNVIILNITCSGSQHYLFSDFIQYIKCSFSSCSLSVFPDPPVHRCFSWKIPEATIRLEVSAVMPMNRESREFWKNGKNIFSKIAGVEWYFISTKSPASTNIPAARAHDGSSYRKE